MIDFPSFRTAPLLLLIGLAALPAGQAADASPIEPIVVKTVPDTVFLCLSRELLPGQIAAFVKEGTAKLRQTADTAHLEVTGPLQYMGPSWNGDGKVSTYILAIPVKAEKPVPAEFNWIALAAHKVASIRVHVPPGTVAKAWDKMDAEIASKGHKSSERWTEVQVSPDGSLVEIQADLE